MRTANIASLICIIMNLSLIRGGDQCKWAEVDWSYYTSKQCDKRDKTKSKEFNDFLKNKDTVKGFGKYGIEWASDDCQQYVDGAETKWVKWECDLDKIVLQEYEDANPITD